MWQPNRGRPTPSGSRHPEVDNGRERQQADGAPHGRERVREAGKEVAVGHEEGSAKSGQRVAGCARPVHVGRTTQVWDVAVTNESAGRTIALFRCTQIDPLPARLRASEQTHAKSVYRVPEGHRTF